MNSKGHRGLHKHPEISKPDFSSAANPHSSNDINGGTSAYAMPGCGPKGLSKPLSSWSISSSLLLTVRDAMALLSLSSQILHEDLISRASSADNSTVVAPKRGTNIYDVLWIYPMI